MPKKLVTQDNGPKVQFGANVSSKDWDAYQAAQVHGDAFTQHEFDFAKRMMNGHYDVRVFNRGRWRYYFKISHPSARRVNCLQRTHGKQAGIGQWEFPVRIVTQETRDTSKPDTKKQVAELGFWQYTDTEAADAAEAR